MARFNRLWKCINSVCLLEQLERRQFFEQSQIPKAGAKGMVERYGSQAAS